MSLFLKVVVFENMIAIELNIETLTHFLCIVLFLLCIFPLAIKNHDANAKTAKPSTTTEAK